MTKTLRQIFNEKCSLEESRKDTFQDTCIKSVKEWLIKKQQEGIENRRGRYYFLAISELLEEFK